MKILIRSCLILLLLLFTNTTLHASESSLYIGKEPFYNNYNVAKVYYVSTNILGEQTIYLKTNSVFIKIHTKSHIQDYGNEIAGYFNKSEPQEFCISKTGERFEGQILCKRLITPPSYTDSNGNIYIKGENNTYANNTVIKGENNISRNNVYIAGSNNTITGNTHYQGSNNIYEDNVVVGSSNNTITNTTTYGASNRTVKGQVIDRSDNSSSSSSRSSYSSNKEDSFLNSKPVKIAFTIIIGIPLALVMVIYIFSSKLSLAVFLIIGIICAISYNPYFLLLPIGALLLFCIYKYPQYKKEQIEHEQRKVEYEQRKQKEAERKIAYQKEQERISTLPTHYVGNVETGKYHHCICSYARKLHKSKREYFETANDAENAGYIPCSICKPNQSCEIYIS